MKIRSKHTTLPFALATIFSFAFPSLLQAQKALPEITAEQIDGVGVSIKVDGQPFTTFNHSPQTDKPFLHPVLGPDQIRMTRDFPIKETAGEANDHPHHKSIWIGHQLAGGDFWSHRDGSRIVVDGISTLATDSATAVGVKSSWVDDKAEKFCADRTIWAFGASPDSRWIDCTWTLIASEGPITIDDTKEGTVAVRTHPDLRLTPDPKRGVEKVFGNALNSNGTTGKELWGESARWVLYHGTIDSKPASLLILDHPSNFRHPTTWHARDYGLIAANPFGLHYFQGLPKQAGAVTLVKNQSLTLRYRFCFFAKAIDADRCEAELAMFENSVSSIQKWQSFIDGQKKSKDN